MTKAFARHTSMSRFNSSCADIAGTHQGLQTRRSTQKHLLKTTVAPNGFTEPFCRDFRRKELIELLANKAVDSLTLSDDFGGTNAPNHRET